MHIRAVVITIYTNNCLDREDAVCRVTLSKIRNGVYCMFNLPILRTPNVNRKVKIRSPSTEGTEIQPQHLPRDKC